MDIDHDDLVLDCHRCRPFRRSIFEDTGAARAEQLRIMARCPLTNATWFIKRDHGPTAPGVRDVLDAYRNSVNTDQYVGADQSLSWSNLARMTCSMVNGWMTSEP